MELFSLPEWLYSWLFGFNNQKLNEGLSVLETVCATDLSFSLLICKKKKKQQHFSQLRYWSMDEMFKFVADIQFPVSIT